MTKTGNRSSRDKWRPTKIMNMRDLSKDDDFISHLLVEKLGTGAVPLVVHKMDPTRRLPKTDADKLMQIVRRLVASKKARQKAIEDAVDELLNQSAVRYYLRDYTQKQINAFATHASRYFELYLPTGSIEIAHTSRYSHRTGKSELCILATRPLTVGAVITELKGSMADLTEEEDKELKRTDAAEGQQEGGGLGIRRDFSVIHSKQLKKNHLFLGPARFVNHDCDHNVELFREGRYITFRVIRPIGVGEEVTAHYGDGYFGKKNRHCLCQTCERMGRGGYGPETSSDEEEEEGSDDARGSGANSHSRAGTVRRHEESSEEEDEHEESRELRASGSGSRAGGQQGDGEENVHERRTRRGVYAVVRDDERTETETVTAAMELDAELEVEEVDLTNGLGLMTPDPDPEPSASTSTSRGRTREREIRRLGTSASSTPAPSSHSHPQHQQLAHLASALRSHSRATSISVSSRPPSRATSTRLNGATGSHPGTSTSKGKEPATRSGSASTSKTRRNQQQHQLVTPPLTAENTSASTPSASNSVRSSSRVRSSARIAGSTSGSGAAGEGSRVSTPALDHPPQYLQHSTQHAHLLPSGSHSHSGVNHVNGHGHAGGSAAAKGKGRANTGSIVSDLREEREREQSTEGGEANSRSLRPRTQPVSYLYSLLDPSHPNHPANHRDRDNHNHHNGGGNGDHHVDTMEAPRGLDGKPLPVCVTCGSVLPVISVDEQVVWGIWANGKTGKRGRPKKEKTVEVECPRCMRHYAIYNVKWPERCYSDGSKAFDVSPPRPWRGPLLDKEKEKERELEKAKEQEQREKALSQTHSARMGNTSKAKSVSVSRSRGSSAVPVNRASGSKKPMSLLGKRAREMEKERQEGEEDGRDHDAQDEHVRKRTKLPTGRPRGRPPKTRVGMSARAQEMLGTGPSTTSVSTPVSLAGPSGAGTSVSASISVGNDGRRSGRARIPSLKLRESEQPPGSVSASVSASAPPMGMSPPGVRVSPRKSHPCTPSPWYQGSSVGGDMEDRDFVGHDGDDDVLPTLDSVSQKPHSTSSSTSAASSLNSQHSDGMTSATSTPTKEGDHPHHHSQQQQLGDPQHAVAFPKIQTPKSLAVATQPRDANGRFGKKATTNGRYQRKLTYGRRIPKYRRKTHQKKLGNGNDSGGAPSSSGSGDNAGEGPSGSVEDTSFESMVGGDVEMGPGDEGMEIVDESRDVGGVGLDEGDSREVEEEEEEVEANVEFEEDEVRVKVEESVLLEKYVHLSQKRGYGGAMMSLEEEFKDRHARHLHGEDDDEEEDGEGYGARVLMDEDSEDDQDEDDDLIEAPLPTSPAIHKIGPSLLGRPNPSAFARRKWATAENTPEPSSVELPLIPSSSVEHHISTDEDSDLPVTPDDISNPVESACASDDEQYGDEQYDEDSYEYDAEMDLLEGDDGGLRSKSVTHSSDPALPSPAARKSSHMGWLTGNPSPLNLARRRWAPPMPKSSKMEVIMPSDFEPEEEEVEYDDEQPEQPQSLPLNGQRVDSTRRNIRGPTHVEIGRALRGYNNVPHNYGVPHYSSHRSCADHVENDRAPEFANPQQHREREGISALRAEVGAERRQSSRSPSRHSNHPSARNHLSFDHDDSILDADDADDDQISYGSFSKSQSTWAASSPKPRTTDIPTSSFKAPQPSSPLSKILCRENQEVKRPAGSISALRAAAGVTQTMSEESTSSCGVAAQATTRPAPSTSFVTPASFRPRYQGGIFGRLPVSRQTYATPRTSAAWQHDSPSSSEEDSIEELDSSELLYRSDEDVEDTTGYTIPALRAQLATRESPQPDLTDDSERLVERLLTDSRSTTKSLGSGPTTAAPSPPVGATSLSFLAHAQIQTSPRSLWKDVVLNPTEEHPILTSSSIAFPSEVSTSPTKLVNAGWDAYADNSSDIDP